MRAIVELGKELVATIARLSALETRTADVVHQQDRIESKLDSLIERLTRLEADYENLRTNVKNEVLNQVVREVTTVQMILKLRGDGKSLPVSASEPPEPEID